MLALLLILSALAAFAAFLLRRAGVHAASALVAPAPRPVLGMERVRRIRVAAEDAALQVALGHAASGRNPYPERTREAVLWSTSFNARLMEFETEAFAPAPAVPGFGH